MVDVVFYVGGHQDDALLFQGDVRYWDLHTAGVRVVQVVTTAGDAGRTDGWWQAREKGLVEACMAAMSPKPVAAGMVSVNGKAVQRYGTDEWVCYFLRLPDGNLDNSGFAATGHRTMGKLRDKTISSLSAVDGTAQYSPWSDLVDTLAAIFDLESEDADNPHPWVNASDWDRDADPGDHPDHYATADALTDIVAPDYNRAWWVSYDTQNRQPNLGGMDLLAKRFAFYAYGWSLFHSVGVPPNDLEWSWWGDKRYGRLEEADVSLLERVGATSIVPG